MYNKNGDENMRMKNIPRGIPKESNIAESIEVGTGGSDHRASHVGPVSTVHNEREDQWFRESQIRDPDPRLARSDYHDVPSSAMDGRTKVETEQIELCEGIIEDVIMYPEGAHIKIINQGNVYFVFIRDINLVVKGTEVIVIDEVTIITYPGIGTTEETHNLFISDKPETESDEIIEEE